MRKLLLCAVMLFGTVCMANAQDDKKISFGVRAGMNMSSYQGDAGKDMDSRIGFHVGGVMDWNVAKNFYVQPGILFTTRGQKKGDYKENLSYIQIPVVAAYRFPISEKFKIDVNAGPYFAMGIGGKLKADGEKIDVFGKDGLDYKRFDAGLRIGAGVMFNKFSVGLAYDLGLTKVAKGSKAKNGAFQISLGYNF